jgi:DNA-binding transcriptional LysR family regulator
LTFALSQPSYKAGKTQDQTAKMQRKPDWAGMQALLAFSRTQSLSGAARQLGVDETTVARQIKRLGETLGAPMLRRIGARLSLSQEGEVAARAAGMMDAAVAPALQLARSGSASDLVDVRVTALAPFLTEFIAPRIPEFLAAHSGIRLDLIADDRVLGIAEREADIAIRFARPQGPHLAGRRLATFAYAVFKAAKAPGKTTSAEPRWLQLSDQWKHLPEAQWLSRTVEDKNIVMRANTPYVLLKAAASGVGQVLLPIALARRHGKLTQVGPVALSREIWLVYHHDDKKTPRIRAVADWLIAVFKSGAQR